MSVATPHLREDLLAPRFYTTEVGKAARTDLNPQREAFEALPATSPGAHAQGAGGL
jgi:magnesium-protoporphyrin IX monomethyl ester (oxidative) cyclase